jgi:hypothetical protein
MEHLTYEYNTVKSYIRLVPQPFYASNLCFFSVEYCTNEFCT